MNIIQSLLIFVIIFASSYAAQIIENEGNPTMIALLTAIISVSVSMIYGFASSKLSK